MTPRCPTCASTQPGLCLEGCSDDQTHPWHFIAPCPFCGSRAALESGWQEARVVCIGCSAEGPIVLGLEPEAAAVRYWNRRP